jgi:hypothetical protein
MKKHLLTIIFAALFVACDSEQNQADLFEDDFLSVEFLNSDKPLKQPLSTRAYMAPARSFLTGQGLSGVISIENGTNKAGIEMMTGADSIATSNKYRLTEFPAIEIEIVSDGETVIPAIQTPQYSSHPYWEVILQAGQQWQDKDHPDWNRVSLPFALKQKNQNCVHNGMMSFAYQPDGGISRIAWQISSETCLYLKVNLWGTLRATFQPTTLPQKDQIINAHRQAIAARLPVKPIADLASDYPAITLAGLTPNGGDDISVHGFVTDGVHYRSGCMTRHGPYPFCDQMVLPSYSLAKSIVAGLSYLMLIQQRPGFEHLTVPELVPECRLSDKRWEDVTMSHLVNMTTGNYKNLKHHDDESSPGIEARFFSPDSHAEKVRFSCEAWPRSAAPGSTAVYHSTDIYLLGAAMSEFIRREGELAGDIYTDHLYPLILEPLNLSPLLSWTERTRDEIAQPFTSHGLVMTANDVVRIAESINSSYHRNSLINQKGFEQAMFRDTNKQIRVFAGLRSAYKHGFWGFNVTEALNCEEDTWVSFMSGFGGISVVMMPNDTVYYYFSDNNTFGFIDAVIESNKIRNICIN